MESKTWLVYTRWCVNFRPNFQYYRGIWHFFFIYIFVFETNFWLVKFKYAPKLSHYTLNDADLHFYWYIFWIYESFFFFIKTSNTETKNGATDFGQNLWHVSETVCLGDQDHGNRRETGVLNNLNFYTETHI